MLIGLDSERAVAAMARAMGSHAEVAAAAYIPAALRNGERYWFTKEEETDTTINNAQFQQLPLEEQLFHQYFRAATDNEEGEYLPAIEILQYIQKRSKVKLSNTSMITFGRLLQNNKIPRKHTSRGNVYRVVVKNGTDYQA